MYFPTGVPESTICVTAGKSNPILNGSESVGNAIWVVSLVLITFKPSGANNDSWTILGAIPAWSLMFCGTVKFDPSNLK